METDGQFLEESEAQEGPEAQEGYRFPPKTVMLEMSTVLFLCFYSNSFAGLVLTFF